MQTFGTVFSRKNDFCLSVSITLFRVLLIFDMYIIAIFAKKKNTTELRNTINVTMIVQTIQKLKKQRLWTETR